MLLSIVTGTYNRLESLIRFVRSVRDAVPPGMEYEIVIVDGGSKDGTLQWCNAQPDIRLIKHGKLKGAIKAFCDGARASSGEYVVMANDDVELAKESIVRALVHLETTSTCGGVAFMDNRPAFKGDKTPMSAKMMPAFDPAGVPTQVVYAQVGMFRRWLGDLVGWWGDEDPIMSQARTYGGDNWLSAKLWEHGYSVDVVKGVQIHDHILEDGLRATNRNYDDNGFYTAYPRGPKVSAKPLVVNPQDERLRILYLPIYEPGNPLHKLTKRGLKEALARRYVVYEIDYLNSANYDLVAVIEAFQPHIMLTQLHDAKSLPMRKIDECRKAKPDMMLINWNGDARGLTEQSYIEMLRKFDLQLVLNAAAFPAYANHGIRAAYWQIGYEEPHEKLPNVPAHDVVFLGNCYSDQRREIERVLLASGLNVGFYGANWQQSDGYTLYDFAAGEALYQRAKIAIGDTFPGTVAFVSNRLIQGLAAGAFMLQQRSDRLEDYTGLVPGEHYIEWTDAHDLAQKLAYWSDDAQALERQRIAHLGQEFVREHFSFDAQVRKLFGEILPRMVINEPA